MNFNKNLIVATIAVALVSSSSVSADHHCPTEKPWCYKTQKCEFYSDCPPEQARRALRRSLQTPEEEAPTAMPILSGVSTPTESPTAMPILSGVGTPTEAPRGGNVDENGCNPSAGYSWCPSLEECIRSFETDCPSAAPTDSPEAPGSDRDENGCIPSAGYSWCEPLKECIKSWETDCPGTTTPSPTKSPTTSPTKDPTTAPTSDEGVSCVDPSTYNPTFTPQCINVGSGGYTCKNVRLGGTPDYRCVAPAPTSRTKDPTPSPTKSPTKSPTRSPTAAPVNRPAPGSDRDENGCIPSAGYSWCEPLEECIKSWETDCPGTTTPSPTKSPTKDPTRSPTKSPTKGPTRSPTGAPINRPAPGSDRDENGCIPSAGYSWCASLEECIKSWETDCPGTTTPSPTKSPIKDPTRSPTKSPVQGSTPSPTKSPVKGPTPSPTGAPVNPAAQPTPRPTNISSSAAALSSTNTIQQYHIAVVATLAASSVVVALVL